MAQFVREVRQVERLQEGRLERDRPGRPDAVEAAGRLRHRGWDLDQAQRGIGKPAEQADQGRERS
jgi:hypothetical protein